MNDLIKQKIMRFYTIKPEIEVRFFCKNGTRGLSQVCTLVVHPKNPCSK